MKTAAIGRLGDVTKLLQTQRRDSLCGACRIFVNGFLPSLPFPRSPQGRRSGGISRWKFVKSLASQSPSKNCRAAAVGKNATRRRVSRIILASVVNASSRRRRGLPAGRALSAPPDL